jgi:hypothetical protein
MGDKGFLFIMPVNKTTLFNFVGPRKRFFLS